MKQHIENFSQYLLEWYNIGQKVVISWLPTYENIVFVGMWWSGMALNVIKTLLDGSDFSLPSQVIREYEVPHWVDHATLMITASYSGNTEETVSAMHDGLSKGATMIAITSWWELKTFADTDHVMATMPVGIEPRAAMPYSLGIQLAIFEKLWHLTDIAVALDRFDTWTSAETEAIITHTTTIAHAIHNRMPFVYSTTDHGAVAIRTEQQLQENSRMLCHHHLIPEHNHNELLGRQEGSDIVDVLWMEPTTMSEKHKLRFSLTRQVLNERNIPQYTIYMEGQTLLESTLSGIYQADRLSYATAMVRGVDPSGMELIEWLKGELKK